MNTPGSTPNESTLKKPSQTHNTHVHSPTTPRKQPLHPRETLTLLVPIEPQDANSYIPKRPPPRKPHPPTKLTPYNQLHPPSFSDSSPMHYVRTPPDRHVGSCPHV